LVSGWGDTTGAKELAKNEAVKALEKALVNAADPVPCPHCVRYQSAMVAALRRTRVRSGWIAGLVVVVIWFISTVVLFAEHALTRGFWATVTSLPLALGSIVAVGCVVAGYIRAATFDPVVHARNNLVPAENRCLISSEQFRSIKQTGFRLIRD